MAKNNRVELENLIVSLKEEIAILKETISKTKERKVKRRLKEDLRDLKDDLEDALDDLEDVKEDEKENSEDLLDSLKDRMEGLEIGNDSFVIPSFIEKRLDNADTLHNDIIAFSDVEYAKLKSGEFYQVKTPYYPEHPKDSLKEYRAYQIEISKIVGKLNTPILYKNSLDKGSLNLSGLSIIDSMIVVLDMDKIIGYTKCNKGGQWSFESKGFKADYRIRLIAMDRYYKISKLTSDLVFGTPKSLNVRRSELSIWEELIKDSKFKKELQK